jgi:hypothetical protein
MSNRISLVGLLMMIAMTGLGAAEPMVVTVYPAVSMAPANVRVQARIEANAANRAIEITADSQNFYRSSIIPLDGASAPRVNVFEFRGLPGGKYEVTAVLIGDNGRRRAYQRQTLNIVGEPSQ